jgi:lipopolysaccharide export system permease protein
MRTKVFFRYIARSFWGPFGFGLGVFCLLLLFGSLFDKLNFFMKSGAGPWLFTRYMLYQAPYFMVKMAPLATLLAVLSALGGMMSRGEWKAGLAGGWRPFDMIKPLLACSLLAGVGQFILQETAAPELFMRSEYIFEEKIRGRDDWQRLVRRDVTFSAGAETFIAARVFDGRSGAMQEVIANIYRGGRLWRELNAASAVWQPAEGVWDFSGGVLIEYGKDLKPSIRRFDNYRSEISAPPGDLVLEKLVADGISTAGLLRRLRLLEAAGSPSTEEHTLLWVKLAAPLASPAMALIGAAMVLLAKKNNRFMNFGLSVGLGFFFWAVIIMAQEAGNAGLLPPLVAGFAPALLFAAVSLWGLRRARAI